MENKIKKSMWEKVSECKDKEKKPNSCQKIVRKLLFKEAARSSMEGELNGEKVRAEGAGAWEGEDEGEGVSVRAAKTVIQRDKGWCEEGL